MLQGSVKEWMESSCGCDFQLVNFQPTCYDESTIKIMMKIITEHHNISMDNVIAKLINRSASFMLYAPSGLVICLNPYCKFNNQTTEINTTSVTAEKFDDKSSLQIIVGSTVGALCGIIIFLLIIITLICVICKRYIKPKIYKIFPTSLYNPHIYATCLAV